MERTGQVDQRRHPRFPGEVRVSVRSDSSESLGRTVDLSPAGLSVLLGHAFEPGDDLEGRFWFPDGRCLTFRASVRWVRRQSEGAYGLGLEFTVLPESAFYEFLGYRAVAMLRAAPGVARAG